MAFGEKRLLSAYFYPLSTGPSEKLTGEIQPPYESKFKLLPN